MCQNDEIASISSYDDQLEHRIVENDEEGGFCKVVIEDKHLGDKGEKVGGYQSIGSRQDDVSEDVNNNSRYWEEFMVKMEMEEQQEVETESVVSDSDNYLSLRELAYEDEGDLSEDIENDWDDSSTDGNMGDNMIVEDREWVYQDVATILDDSLIEEDLGDIDLEDLLEIERMQEENDQLFIQFHAHGNFSNLFAYPARPTLATPSGLNSDIQQPLRPFDKKSFELPVPNSSVKSNVIEVELRETLKSSAEEWLKNDPKLGAWRCFKTSRLRKSWTPVKSSEAE